MKITMKTIELFTLAGLASAALFPVPVLADDPAPSDDFLSARVLRYIYVNAATGERVATSTSPSRLGDLFWQNDDIAGSCSFFFGQDRPTRDTTLGRVKFGSAAVHWGDLPVNSLINGYDVAYATNIACDTLGTGIGGFGMINAFLEDYDGLVSPGGAESRLVISFILEDISGGDCTLCTDCFPGNIYTVDLEGSGLEFELGDQDLDGDGLLDFGYSYEFIQGQTEAKGIAGPFLVRPDSLGGLGSAAGCPDRYDWFNQLDGPTTFSHYIDGFWFGGGDCSVLRPYASLFLNLYGSSSFTVCTRIDYAPDGLIDFLDYLQFLNNFDAQHPAADLNDDGLVDFGDYLEFLNLYDACTA